jgi:hypothetical protein
MWSNRDTFGIGLRQRIIENYLRTKINLLSKAVPWKRSIQCRKLWSFVYVGLITAYRIIFRRCLWLLEIAHNVDDLCHMFSNDGGNCSECELLDRATV